MKRHVFKFLTSIILPAALLSLSSVEASIPNVGPQLFKTHFRLNIFAPKERIVISKKNQNALIQTLDKSLYIDLKKSFSEVEVPNDYIKSIQFESDNKNGPFTINITLQKSEVELFSFYKESESKHVIDFWLSSLIEDKVNVSPIENKFIQDTENHGNISPLNTETKKINNEIQDNIVSQNIVEDNTGIKSSSLERTIIKDSVKTKKSKQVKDKSNDYRDFRYGAAFIWDYAPLLPEVSKSINIERKTPEFFYPISDRAYDKDEKEAHLQLSINLYRKEKYGLMSKSISLYEKKYGENDANQDINDYLKANSLLRENIKNNNLGVQKSAVNILVNIVERTSNYEMQKGIWQYLIAYHLELKDFISALQVSKTLYVETKGKFDRELSEKAAELILYCLAELAQIEKIDAFIEEKSIKKLIPDQLALAYKSYVLLFRDRPKEVVDLFEKNKVIIQNQIEPALLFNTAESYFRVGDYEKAIKLFDKYILGNSFNPKSSFARVRLALSYEILDKDIKLILELYKNAINRASTPEARYEAKLRYVAVLLARKSEITEKDKESLVFLEHDVDETKALTQNLKHLLWIVRLRTLINQEKFDESLAYLTGIPLDSLRPAERRTFEGDGAEIVYGLISKLYQKGDYPKLLKVWETYSAKYVDKVAMDPQINFIICSSYLRMKLYESFERALTKFNDLSVTVPRSFPIWVERGETNNQSSLIKELAVLKSIYAKNWDQALVDLKKIDENELKNEKIKYYRGIIHYNKKEYQLGLDDIERFLVKYDKNRALPDEELSQLLEAYYESLYALGRIDKFETVVIALIKDLEEKTDKTPFLMECLERMTYLLIETLSSDSDKKNDSDIAGYINDFQKTFPKSVYDGRIRFLQAQNFIKFNKMDEGLSIFNKLLDDNTVPTYIKELTRTELSSIQLQNRSI